MVSPSVSPSMTSSSESYVSALPEDSSASSSQDDQNTMSAAGSIPTACSSSINSEQSASAQEEEDDRRISGIVESLHKQTDRSNSLHRSLNASTVSNDVELGRIQELETKRLALRHQRFSLEQRLYEFCGKHAEGSPTGEVSQRIQNLEWKDHKSGLKVVYSGSLNESGQPHGVNGKLEFSDGQVYTGDVRNGVRAGQGRNIWADGQDYVGEWKSNSRNGRGTHIWPDGRKVSGQWQDGHLNGKVYFSWPNGATYDGLVRKGKKHGRGKS